MRQTQHFVAGILFSILALVFLIAGWSYPVGTMSQMGPGMFPRIGSSLLLICALLLTLKSAPGLSFAGLTADRVAREVRITLVILAAIIVFGLLIERAGIVVSIVALFLISCLAGERRSVHSALVGAAAMAAFMTIVFVYALNIPMKVLP